VISVLPPNWKKCQKREIQKKREEEAWKRVEESLSRLPWWWETAKDEGVQEVTATLKFPEESRE
jgi:hypothetical protein